MTIIRSNRRVAALLVGLIGIGTAFVGPATPAGADIDDLCGDPINQCQDPLDGPDDLCADLGDGCNPQPDPDPEPEPEPQPEPELPPADVDGTVVANPTFTG
jgi:hypothetical protein